MLLDLTDRRQWLAALVGIVAAPIAAFFRRPGVQAAEVIAGVGPFDERLGHHRAFVRCRATPLGVELAPRWEVPEVVRLPQPVPIGISVNEVGGHITRFFRPGETRGCRLCRACRAEPSALYDPLRGVADRAVECSVMLPVGLDREAEDDGLDGLHRLAMFSERDAAPLPPAELESLGIAGELERFRDDDRAHEAAVAAHWEAEHQAAV
jgi:hypothetical protein